MAQAPEALGCESDLYKYPESSRSRPLSGQEANLHLEAFLEILSSSAGLTLHVFTETRGVFSPFTHSRRQSRSPDALRTMWVARVTGVFVGLLESKDFLFELFSFVALCLSLSIVEMDVANISCVAPSLD